jgi:hypothetical protein
MGMGERVRTRLKGSGQGGERMPNIVGGCLCGSVRYESVAEPTLTAVCHCHHCQKQTSSAFSIFVVLPKGSLRIEGEPLAAFEDVGESGLPVFRKFCPKCGSAIVSEVVATPDLEWLNAGTLDDPSWFRPQMNLWCESAQPWVSIDDSIPPYAGNPPQGD